MSEFYYTFTLTKSPSMHDTITATSFEGFAHKVTELSAYIYSIDTFIISLHTREIIRFVTDRPDDFRQWLEHHGIRNVNETLGKMVHDYYFPPGKK